MDSTKKTEKNDQLISCLEEIAECVPGNFYWKNKDGVYLGCNKSVLFGCGYEELIGKTDYDLWPNQATELRENDVKVMSSSVPMHFEEFIQCNDGTTIYFTVVKIPLKNEKGEIVGIIGNSLDITKQKEAENLKIENELNKIAIKEQEKFRKVAEQISHDIRTPLDILDMTLSICSQTLAEKEHIKLRDSITRIKQIIQVFLEYSPDREVSLDHQHILVSEALNEAVEQGVLQYSSKKNVEFNCSFDPFLRFTFIYGNILNFERMIGNLIKNSVEALEGKNGVIEVGFTTSGNNVKITIKDNGKGMPQKIVEKLMRGESVSTTKVYGHGIGTGQIQSALEEFGGKQFIESTINVGTKITLTIPKSDNPRWVIEQITLNKGDTVVILDDDVLIHHKWKDGFEQYASDVFLRFFENGQKTVDFINSFEDKNKLFLLSDYELRGQKLNGLDVIQKSSIRNSQSVIVSSIYNRKEIQSKAVELGVKILPKVFIEHVQVILEKKSEEKADHYSSPADIVIVDDSESFVDSLSTFLQFNGIKKVDTYCHPEALLKNLSKYSINTKIFMDNDLACNISGEDLAKQLTMHGFKNLYVLSGSPAKTLLSKYPKGTRVIEKGKDIMNDLICCVQKT